MTTYTLLEPISVTVKSGDGDREEQIFEVTVRKPVAKDLRVTDRYEGEVAKSLAMIETLTDLTAAQVDRLSVADVAGLGEIIEGFISPGLPTGQRP